VITRLSGLAIDARFAIPAAMPGTLEPIARARAARWIAANALATRGIELAVEGTPPAEPRILVMRAASCAGMHSSTTAKQPSSSSVWACRAIFSASHTSTPISTPPVRRLRPRVQPGALRDGR